MKRSLNPLEREKVVTELAEIILPKLSGQEWARVSDLMKQLSIRNDDVFSEMACRSLRNWRPLSTVTVRARA